MKHSVLLLAIIAGTSFGTWPNLIGSATYKIPAGFITLAISIGLCITAVIQMKTQTSSLSENQIQSILPYLISAAIINAIGYLAYTPILEASKQVGSSVYIIIALVITPLAAYLYIVIFKQEILSLKNILAMALIVGGIIILKIK